MEDLVTVLQQALGGKKVLVTGHTGFKGAWLCAWLLELGVEPHGYALQPPTDPSLFDRARLAERMDHRVADLRDLDQVEAWVNDLQPDLIVHMAAQAIVRESYQAPLETFQTNTLGTANLLEAVRRRAKPCVVVAVTSDKCYEVGQRSQAFTEGDPMGGSDPYSGSKGAAELVVASYRHSFFPPGRFAEHGVALASVRAGNVIGGGDWAADRIVPDIVRAVTAGRPPELRNPSAVRPWQHVLDALSGYLWLAASMLDRGAQGLAEAWNFGPLVSRALSVAELTERMLRDWGREGWNPSGERDAPPELEFLRLDCGKAVSRLDWRPVYDAKTAIRQTVRWHQADMKADDMSAVTARQVREYIETAEKAGLTWAGNAEVAGR